jgi:hypothetical protein
MKVSSVLVGSQLVAVLVAGMLAGCEVGVGVGSEDGNSSTERKYNFTYNGCSTGDQVFDSTQAYCDGLRDQARNKGCAVQTRKEAFERDCAGQSWELTGFGPVACDTMTCDGRTQYCLMSYGGSSKTPTGGVYCRNLPAGFDFEDGCDSLRVEAKAFYNDQGTNNCGGQGVTTHTSCSITETGSYKFTCRVWM